MIPVASQLRLPGGVRSDAARVLLDLVEARFGGIDPSVVLVNLFEQVPESALPALGWQFDIAADEWASSTVEQRRELVRGAIARQRKRGTPGVMRRALEAVGHEAVHFHEDIVLYCDGSIVADGTFVAGADAHWAKFWLVLLQTATPEDLRIVEEWKRHTAELARVYYVHSEEDFGDVSSYELALFPLSGLKLWIASDDAETVALEAGTEADMRRVVDIDNRVEGAEDYLTQASSPNRPVLATFPEGRAMCFAGSAQVIASNLPAADWAWLNSGAPWTGYFVTRSGNTNNVQVLRTAATTAHVGVSIQLENTDDLRVIFWTGSGASALTWPDVATDWTTATNIWGVVFDGVNAELFKNGVSQGAQAVAPTPGTPTLSLQVGNSYTGFLPELLLWDRALDAGERQVVEAHLSRWVLQLSVDDIVNLGDELWDIEEWFDSTFGVSGGNWSGRMGNHVAVITGADLVVGADYGGDVILRFDANGERAKCDSLGAMFAGDDVAFAVTCDASVNAEAFGERYLWALSRSGGSSTQYALLHRNSSDNLTFNKSITGFTTLGAVTGAAQTSCVSHRGATVSSFLGTTRVANEVASNAGALDCDTFTLGTMYYAGSSSGRDGRGEVRHAMVFRRAVNFGDYLALRRYGA